MAREGGMVREGSKGGGEWKRGGIGMERESLDNG